MQKRRLIYALLATSVVSSGTAVAQEWWGDSPYWRQQQSGMSSASVVAVEGAQPGTRGIFGRPVVRVTPIDGLDAFDPARDAWLYAHRSQVPVQYAQRRSETMTDAGNSGETLRAPRDNGPQMIDSIEAERKRLDGSGFPQYNP